MTNKEIGTARTESQYGSALSPDQVNGFEFILSLGELFLEKSKNINIVRNRGLYLSEAEYQMLYLHGVVDVKNRGSCGRNADGEEPGKNMIVLTSELDKNKEAACCVFRQLHAWYSSLLSRVWF